MNHFVLFDLDNTLVDSLHLKPLRDARKWPQVYARIEGVSLFDGIDDVWRQLRKGDFHLGIVTHSPRPYAEKVLARVGLKPDELVAYHDLDRHLKPSPYGYEKCCKGRPSTSGAAVGDDQVDLIAADAFKCRGAFAGWSRNPTLTEEQCRTKNWIYLKHPRDIIELL